MRPLWIFSGAFLAALLTVLTWVYWPAPALLVDDRAKLMTAEQVQRLTAHHGYLLSDHDIDYRVVTGRDFGDLNSAAASAFASLGVGGESTAGRGLLLLLDGTADRVRLEVGYGLEGVFPDAFIAYLEHRQMVPFFAAGRVADGILATTELIITRTQNEKAKAGFAGEAWAPAGSGGGGAVAQAGLTGEDPNAAALAQTAQAGMQSAGGPGRSPTETLSLYLAAMQARNANPDLAIYSAETKVMLRDWVVTPAQMDNIVKTYRPCRAEAPRSDSSGQLAVIRYPPGERACAPWFFRKAAGGWTLDLTLMGRVIRFGRNNAWRFDPAADHPYRFAFEDWRFDQNGFPRDQP